VTAGSIETAPLPVEGRRPARAAGVWWVSPVGAVLLITVPTLWYSSTLDDSTYRFAWGAGRALSADLLILLMTGAFTFVAGAAVPLLRGRPAPSRPWPALSAADRGLLRAASRYLFWGTIAGYLLLLALGASRGVTPFTIPSIVANGGIDSGALKSAYAPIAGLTTFTQLGIATVIVGALLLVSGGDRRALIYVIVVIAISVPRAYLLSERLATMELVVPLIVVLALAGVTQGRATVARAWRRAPLLFLPLVVVGFAVFEYARSWSFYSSRTAEAFPVWALERLLGYYVTSFNNGALVLTYGDLPGRLPYDTVEAVWTAPGIAQAQLYQRLSATGSDTRFDEILAQHGNPEFNSPCGLCSFFVDYGRIGGLIALALAGLLLGTLYVHFIRANPVSLLVYPALVAGLFEFPRYVYWATGRLVPSMVALVVIALLVRRRRRAEDGAP
jgi:hypothetical protein